MEYDSDENYLEFIGPDMDEADHSMDDDEALLDEGEEDEEGDDEQGEGEGDEGSSGGYGVGHGEYGPGQEGEVGEAVAEGDFSAAGDQEPAAAANTSPSTAAAVNGAVPDDGTGTPDAAAAVPGTDGGLEGGEGGGDQENEVGEAGGLSDGDFDKDDLVLEEDGEDEVNSKLKPDHRFFCCQGIGGGWQNGQEA
jgi:hypothetical protein